MSKPITNNMHNRRPRKLASSCGFFLAALWALFAIQQQVDLASSNEAAGSQPHHNPLDFYVFENASIGTCLGTIQASDGQTPQYILARAGTTENELKQSFSFNYTHNEICTNGTLDRERRQKYYFTAVVAEPFGEIECTIHVEDVNDNAPYFVLNQNETSVVIDFPEGWTGEPLRRLLPMARDPDEPKFGLREFRLVTTGPSAFGVFSLIDFGAPAIRLHQQQQRFASGDPEASASTAFLSGLQMGQSNSGARQKIIDEADTVLVPSLNQDADNILKASSGGQLVSASQQFQFEIICWKELDREKHSSYFFHVEAIDNGDPPLVGRLSVTINVLDINDNDPIFTQQLYEAHFKEDTAKGTMLLKVLATDADINANAQITYSIKSHKASPSSQFNSSQPISTSNNNNHNSSSSNNNFIDLNQQRFQQHQAANNKQQMTKQAQQQQQQVNKPQPSTGGSQQKLTNDLHNESPLAHVGTSEHQFEIDPVKGEIYLMHSLDYESDQVHELVIEARDHGSPARSSVTLFRLQVIDVPDDPPPATASSPSGRNGNSLGDDNRKYPLPNSPDASPLGARPYPSGPGGLSSIMDFSNVSVSTLLNQVSSPQVIFFIVLICIVMVAALVFFAKIKSLRSDSSYKTERVTNHSSITPSNGTVSKCKQISPNHSTSNEHSSGSLTDGHHQHRHHGHHLHNSNRHLSGGHHTAANSFIADLRVPSVAGTNNLMDSSNFYQNPYNQLPPHMQPRHSASHIEQVEANSRLSQQMAGVVVGGSAGNTMTLHHHQHHQHALLDTPPPPHNILSSSNNNNNNSNNNHHSLEHHQFIHGGGGTNHGAPGSGHHSSSLTYAHHHQRAAALQQHHKSTHHLSLHQHYVNHNHLMAATGAGGAGGIQHAHQHGHPNGHHRDTHNHHPVVGALQHQQQQQQQHQQQQQQHQLFSTSLATAAAVASGQDKTGSINSIRTQQSNHHNHSYANQQQLHGNSQRHRHNSSTSPLPLTPTHTSGLNTPYNGGGPLLPGLITPSALQQCQLPPTPGVANGGPPNVFTWNQTPSVLNGLSGANGSPTGTEQNINTASNNNASNIAANNNNHELVLDRWLEASDLPQIVYTQDWHGPYNWDYLSDWLPDYNPVMPLVQSETCGY